MTDDTHTALLREARDILAVYHSAITRYREIQGRRGGDTPTMANQIRAASIACSEQATGLLRKLDAALSAPAPEPAPPMERLTPSDAKFLAQTLVANGVYLATAPMIKKLLRIATEAAEPASGVPPLLRVVKQCPRHQGAVMMMSVGWAPETIPYCPNCEQEDAERERREGGK